MSDDANKIKEFRRTRRKLAGSQIYFTPATTVNSVVIIECVGSPFERTTGMLAEYHLRSRTKCNWVIVDGPRLTVRGRGREKEIEF